MQGYIRGDGSETRLNIDYSTLEGIESMFRNITEQLIQAATAAKDHQWPGKGMTDAQVRENYTSPLITRDDCFTLLRCKIDSDKFRCWSYEGAKIPFPTNRGKAANYAPAFSCKVSGSCHPNGGLQSRRQTSECRIHVWNAPGEISVHHNMRLRLARLHDQATVPH